jgi:hypothetical protein
MTSLADSKFLVSCKIGDIATAKIEWQKIVDTQNYRAIVGFGFFGAFENGHNTICEWISELHPFFVFERRRGGFTSAKIDKSKSF